MNPLQKMRLLVARGVLNLAKHAGLQVLQINLLEDETRDEVERVQNYGFSGMPPAGSTLVAVAVGGSRDHLMVVACEHPDHSPVLETGESAMYSQFGQLIKMDKDGNVTLTCKGLTFDVAENFEQKVGGNLTQQAKGALSITASGGSSVVGGFNADKVTAEHIEENGIRLGTHHHGGVMPGGSNTGEPTP